MSQSASYRALNEEHDLADAAWPGRHENRLPGAPGAHLESVDDEEEVLGPHDDDDDEAEMVREYRRRLHREDPAPASSEPQSYRSEIEKDARSFLASPSLSQGHRRVGSMEKNGISFTQAEVGSRIRGFESPPSWRDDDGDGGDEERDEHRPRSGSPSYSMHYGQDHDRNRVFSLLLSVLSRD